MMTIDQTTPYHLLYGVGATICLTEYLARQKHMPRGKAFMYAAIAVTVGGLAKEGNDHYQVIRYFGSPDLDDIIANTIGIISARITLLKRGDIGVEKKGLREVCQEAYIPMNPHF